MTTPEEIDSAEIKSVLAKAIACLSAGLIDMRTAAKITTAAKRANTLVRDGFVATGCQSCVDAPWEASGFSLWAGNMVRRFRVSGLVMRPFTCRGPVWKSADRVQVGVARSRRSD